MRVNIDEIKESGLDRAWELTRDQLDEFVRGEQAGYRAGGPARVDVHLERLGRRIHLRARSQAELHAPCGRCLVSTEVRVPVDFELTLVPADDRPPADREEQPEREQDRQTGSFAPEEVDEERYSGKTVELDPLVREQLLLALPRYPVCREECRGLCSVCGQNLNERDCGCDRRVPDPRWAALEKLKLQ
jgi:uncharacterized protein